MSIRAVIFDADGVVVLPWRFAEHLTREHGITQETVREFFQGEFHDCIVGRADLKDILPPYLDKWGWTETAEEFMQMWFAVEDAVDERVVETVQALRQQGYVCCLATNQEQHRAKYMTTTMGFDALFDRLFFSCEMGVKKPDPEFYAAIEASLGLRGDEIAFWDDSPSHVDAAKHRGWAAELYTNYGDFERQVVTLQEQDKKKRRREKTY